MKLPITVFALVVICLFTASISAQDISSQDGSPMDEDMDKQLSDMQKDMNTMLQQIAKLRLQSQLHKSVYKMQRQIEDLESTTDPKKRQKLIQEHIHTIQEHMKIISSMSEHEASSASTMETSRSAPGRMPAPNRMMYGPNSMGIPGVMRYGYGGPGMMGGSQVYPGWMAGPGRSVTSPPGGTPAPWDR